MERQPLTKEAADKLKFDYEQTTGNRFDSITEDFNTPPVVENAKLNEKLLECLNDYNKRKVIGWGSFYFVRPKSQKEFDTLSNFFDALGILDKNQTPKEMCPLNISLVDGKIYKVGSDVIRNIPRSYIALSLNDLKECVSSSKELTKLLK